MIGLGLAFPFILLGFAPKAIKLIPKPGDWMTTFKEIMGFLLFGTALYLLYTLHYLISGIAFLNTLTFLLVLSFASWIYGKFAGPMSSILKTMDLDYYCISSNFWFSPLFIRLQDRYSYCE